MLVTMTDSGREVHVGDHLELDISGVAHGGVFVARHEGRVVFVSDAVPGERVRARLSDLGHSSFWRADTVEVLTSSADRQEHVWDAAALERDPDERAGGAEFGHISPERQRALKAEVLVDALSRFGGVDAVSLGFSGVTALPGEPDGTRWRTRVRLHVGADGAVGPYAARSHRVVPMTTLPLATAAVRDAAPHRVGGDVSAVDVIATSTGDVRVQEVGDRGSVSRGTTADIVERVGSREFRLAADGFWQVHTAAAETLTRAVQDAIDENRFDPAADNLDLYGGVGLLAAAMGDRFGPKTRVTSVESDSRATEHAGRNLADWVGARAVTARVDRYLGRSGGGSRTSARAGGGATVVLDPPRSGAGKGVMGNLLRARPAQVVYVACDPVALARDIGYAARDGYRVASLRAFDLFPNTHHVEAVATLVPE